MYGFECPSFLFLTLFSPTETVLFMIFISFGMIAILKRVFEGIMYNASDCASFGGCAVILIIWKAATLFQYGGIPSFLAGHLFHLAAIALSMMIAIANIRTNLKKEPGKKETVADTYHNWVLLPGYIYLVISSLVIIARCGSGADWALTGSAVVVFVFTGLLDAATGRLDQPKYMRVRGYHFPDDRA